MLLRKGFINDFVLMIEILILRPLIILLLLKFKSMKKLFLFALLITSLSIIISCNKSDEKRIIGSWRAYHLNVKLYVDGAPNGEESEELATNVLTHEFYKGNTYKTWQYGSLAGDGTYSISDDKLIMGTATYTYQLSGKNLDLFFTTEEIDNGHTIRYEIEVKLKKI